MPICPNGHVSSTEDYCDECGTPLSREPLAPVTNRSHRTEMISAAAVAPTGELCLRCATPRTARDRFCEGCGYDFTAPADERPVVGPVTEWEVVVDADREYFARVAPDGLAFPADSTPATFPLEAEALVGRRSESRGVHPEIDLSGPLDDPGVSHRHARLVRTADEGYELVDVGSTNGTTVNDDLSPVAPDTRVRLDDGDRIHVGAWTTLTIRRVTSAPTDGRMPGSADPTS